MVKHGHVERVGNAYRVTDKVNVNAGAKVHRPAGAKMHQ